MARKLPTLVGKFTTRKPNTPGYVGPRAIKMLEHLRDNGPTAGPALLGLIKPEFTDYGLENYGTGNYRTSRTWGNSYFLTNPGGNGHRASLILRGYVINTGVKQGRSFLYAITPKGLALLAGMF